MEIDDEEQRHGGGAVGASPAPAPAPLRHGTLAILPRGGGLRYREAALLFADKVLDVAHAGAPAAVAAAATVVFVEHEVAAEPWLQTLRDRGSGEGGHAAAPPPQWVLYTTRLPPWVLDTTRLPPTGSRMHSLMHPPPDAVWSPSRSIAQAWAPIAVTWLPPLPSAKTVGALQVMLAETAASKTYDVAFVGRLTQRRLDVLLACAALGLRVQRVQAWGATRDSCLAQCHVLLNIHAEADGCPYEAARCARWVAAGMPLVTERGATGFDADDPPPSATVAVEPLERLAAATLAMVRAHGGTGGHTGTLLFITAGPEDMKAFDLEPVKGFTLPAPPPVAAPPPVITIDDDDDDNDDDNDDDKDSGKAAAPAPPRPPPPPPPPPRLLVQRLGDADRYVVLTAGPTVTATAPTWGAPPPPRSSYFDRADAGGAAARWAAFAARVWGAHAGAEVWVRREAVVKTAVAAGLIAADGGGTSPSPAAAAAAWDAFQRAMAAAGARVVMELPPATAASPLPALPRVLAAMARRRVLVVSPFAHHMAAQEARGALAALHAPRILVPDADVFVAPALLRTYQLLPMPPCATSGALLLRLVRQLTQYYRGTYDVALVDCGIYNAPVAAALAVPGTTAICVGDELPLLFGIVASARWDDAAAWGSVAASRAATPAAWIDVRSPPAAAPQPLAGAGATSAAGTS